MAIHRFKCSNELNEKIMDFSEIHKFDLKDNLKEQFDSWLKENEFIIEKEKELLKENDYEGDIHIKIFKSIKYYYIKKFLKEKEEKKEKEKKEKIRCPLLKEIKEDIENNFQTNRGFKPADSYITFLETNQIEGTDHIKKCYKNIYYQIKNNKFMYER